MITIYLKIKNKKMEDKILKTEPHQRLSKKIGKHLRATHYKLGVDGK